LLCGFQIPRNRSLAASSNNGTHWQDSDEIARPQQLSVLEYLSKPCEHVFRFIRQIRRMKPKVKYSFPFSGGVQTLDSAFDPTRYRN